MDSRFSQWKETTCKGKERYINKALCAIRNTTRISDGTYFLIHIYKKPSEHVNYKFFLLMIKFSVSKTRIKDKSCCQRICGEWKFGAIRTWLLSFHHDKCKHLQLGRDSNKEKRHELRQTKIQESEWTRGFRCHIG